MQRTTVVLLVLLTLGSLGAPFTAAQTRKVAHIGLLDYTPSWEPFRQALRDLGYQEGENLHLEYRLTEGRRERLPELAAELVRLPVDVLDAVAPAAVSPAREAYPHHPNCCDRPRNRSRGERVRRECCAARREMGAS